MLLLGIDLGSSAIKAAVFDPESGRTVASAQSPQEEMPIASPRPGWAEQNPEFWWQNVVTAVRSALAQIDASRVRAVGIAYQMHGLVTVDKNSAVVRPAIIWCDSRAAEIGERAFAALGAEHCFRHLLNSPGNFTAAKLRWVQENEPENFRRIHKFMLPGDYLAMRLTGKIQTTASGLSEATLWDFQAGQPAKILLDHFGFGAELLPEIVPAFGLQAELSPEAAAELGLPAGTPVTYRAGDQPNNAFALNVLDPGEIAATAGTSGVIYGVSDRREHDATGRVNTFAHVNHSPAAPRLGILLCINGAAILNAWLRKTLAPHLPYDQMNALAAEAPAGSDGLTILPFGNGAERMLNHRQPGCRWSGLDFNRHRLQHLCRAVQEGIVFAFRHGIESMKSCGLTPRRIRAGHANLFRSVVFREMLASALGVAIELVKTDGAAGAARAAGVGAGIFADTKEAFRSLEMIATIEPPPKLQAATEAAYARWESELNQALSPFGDEIKHTGIA